VIGLAYREIEDGQNRIAHRLVQEPIVSPNRGRALVVENVEQCRQALGGPALRKHGIATQIGEEHRGIGCNVTRLHDPAESHLADRTGIGVHPAGSNAEQAERSR